MKEYYLFYICKWIERIIPLLTSLAISTLLFFALLVHHCRLRHTLRTSQQGVEATTQDTPAVRGTSSIPSGTPTPQQSLSPVTPPPHHPPPPPYTPPWPPAPSIALSPMASASSEAWYCEMYPTATVAPPPNSYALLDAKTEETINDMYESADEL
ncbi:extensin-like [Penaeus japonicus]|uniref:extensin-like n=1 Tax=Penaeus japonicus TaxID=27405 RepID=UPI001C713072|nr:extensin-like [Penaeus japonicus]